MTTDPKDHSAPAENQTEEQVLENAGENNAEATPTEEDVLLRLARENEELKDRALRLAAEMENLRRRTQRDVADARSFGIANFARDMLAVSDNLQRALQAAEQGGDIEQLVQGVQMVFQQFHDVLAKYHIEVIPAVGQPFDPNLHEAVQQMPSNEHPPMTVLHEVERGYRLHDRIVRPSKVIVSSAAPQAPAES